MTIGYVARRLVEAYGRDAARDKAHFRSCVWGCKELFAPDVAASRRCSIRASRWRSVARACTRVPVPARRGATP